MKKFLIPIIGLLVLIFLTPVILGKIANSNIDKKISELKQQGMIIKEVSKDIGYLNTKREFKVILNRKFKNKTWQKYRKFISTIDADVVLKFKNLPITKADMDIIGDVKILKTRLKNIKLHLITKNFKDFEYQITNIDNMFLNGINGEIHKKKYIEIFSNIQKLESKNIKIYDTIIKSKIKNLYLSIGDIYIKSKKFEFRTIKAENLEENISTHLLPNNDFIIKDTLKVEKFGIKIKNQFIGFGYLKTKFELNYQKHLTLNLKWENTEYQKAIVDGGEIDLNMDILNPQLKSLKDINLIANIKAQKSLFKRVTKDFDPAIVNRYFKDYKSHIEIKNGEILVNGNRIQ